MESFTRICAGTVILTLAAMSWLAFVWAISPFIAEAASAMQRAYGH